MSKMHGGKGDAPRPLSVPKEEFDKNFEAIFGKKKTPAQAREERLEALLKQDRKSND